jgi:hypothetical protein
VMAWPEVHTAAGTSDQVGRAAEWM